MNNVYTISDASIQTSDVQWNITGRSIRVGRQVIPLTITEYRILSILGCGKPVKYTDLSVLVYGCPFDERVRMMIDKHVDRMRNKLRGSGVYIYCVTNYGYLFLPEAA